MSELKPCPFCGGRATVKTRYIGYGSIGLGEHDEYRVVCKECRASSDEYRHEAEAIAAWNRRADHLPDATKMVTNADRIRSMSNTELAEMLVRYDSNLYGYYCPDGSFCDDEDSALSFALDWLDKPAKGETPWG